MTEDPDIGMKKPHRRLFLAQWQALGVGPQQDDQQAGGGGGAAATAAATAGDSDALLLFGARCIDFNESETGTLGPVRGVFDDKTNPRVGIDKAIEGTVVLPDPSECRCLCLRVRQSAMCACVCAFACAFACFCFPAVPARSRSV